MDNEQKFSIPLDSPLDINSNDMLVSASSPKFSFNRQRYLGSVLQNSVRFEADGWFAGWWVHNFDKVTTGAYSYFPTNLGDIVIQDKIVPGYPNSIDSPRYWIVSWPEYKLELKFNVDQYEKWITGARDSSGTVIPGTITRIDDQTVRITGTTNSLPVGQTWTADVNAYTGNIISFTASDPSLIPSCVFENGVYKFKVERPFVLGADTIWIRYGENVTIEAGSHDYTFDGVTHRWGTLLTYTGGVLTMPTNPMYDLVSYAMINAGMESEFIDTTIRSKGTFTLVNPINMELIGGLDSFWNVVSSLSTSKGLVDEGNTDPDKQTAPDLTTRMLLYPYNFTPGGAIPTTWTSSCIFGYAVPVWIKIANNYRFEIELEVYDRHPYIPAVYGPPDPVTGIPPLISPAVPEWYECIPYVRIQRGDKMTSLQNSIDDIGVDWWGSINGIFFSDSMIPTTGFLRFPLQGGTRISNRSLPTTGYGLTLVAISTNIDPLHPFPAGMIFAIMSGVITTTSSWPAYSALPQPPPPYAPLWTETSNPDGGAKPVDWANPVTYPMPWPPQPADWANPVAWPPAWPRVPLGWANPVVWAPNAWPATLPNDWPTAAAGATLAQQRPWPLVWPFGIDTVPNTADGADYNWPVTWTDGGGTVHNVESYADYMARVGPPAGWPTDAGKAWPVIPNGGYTPVVTGAPNPTAPTTWATLPWNLPTEWPYGITNAPPYWYSTTESHAAYLTATGSPAGFPITMTWPVTPEPGYVPSLTVQPNAWIPPYPPNWPFGIMGLPANEWFSVSVTADGFMAANKPANWPVPWAMFPNASYTFPFPPIAWIPRTPAAWNGVVNPVAPAEWEPNWPINWPYGISTPPPGWYSVGTSYMDYLLAHRPYRAPASATGDQGFTWPVIGSPVKDAIPLGSENWPCDPDAAWLPPWLYYDEFGTGLMIAKPWAPATWPIGLLLEIESTSALAFGTILTDYLGYFIPLLNRHALSLSDPKLLKVSVNKNSGYYGVDFNLVLPLCTWAFSFNQILTDDITLCKNATADPLSWHIREVGNTELGIRCFRLDTDAGREFPAGSGSNKYSLRTLTATMGSVNVDLIAFGTTIPKHLSVIPFDMDIELKNTGGVIFDKVTRYSWPGADPMDIPTGNVQDYTPDDRLKEYGFYPEWILPSTGGTKFWRTYSDFSASAGMGVKVKLNITYFAWMKTASSSHTYTPVSDTNASLDGKITAQLNVLDTATPGNFLQHARLIISSSDGGYVDITYGVAAPVPGTVATFTWNEAPWEQVSIGFSWKDPVLTLTTVVKRSVLINLQLRKLLILEQLGMMSSVVITSGTADRVMFNTPFGYINRPSGSYEGYAMIKPVSIDSKKYTYRINVTAANDSFVEYLPLGIWYYSKVVRYISITKTAKTKPGGGVYYEYELKFEYDGTTYTVTLNSDTTTRLSYSVYDIRNGERKELYNRDTKDIIMAVKQFWSNDVRTENYWWIDHEHVLELTKYDLILWEKDKDADGNYLLDDWMGDRWHVTKRTPRGNVFDTADIYYTVSMAFNRRPILIKFQKGPDYGKIGTIIILFIETDKIIAPTFDLSTLRDIDTWERRDVLVEGELAYGQALYTVWISSFVPIDTASLLLSGKISVTIINTDILIGFAMTRGILQWTLRLSTVNADIYNVLNGFGHVGLHGEVTGGFFPSILCDNTGFKDKVYNVSEFVDDEDGSGPDEKTFGSGTTLWFVYKVLTEFVTHYKWEGGTFKKYTIPIQSNYSHISLVSAYRVSYMYDVLPRTLSFGSFLSSGGATDSSGASVALEYMAAIALPSLWFMMPLNASGVFNAQGRHQAAYTWRNRLPSKSDDGKSDKDITVIRDVKDVHLGLNTGKLNALLGIMLSIVGALTEAAADSLSTNASIEANAVQDEKGRKYGQYAANAALDAVAASFNSYGLVLTARTKTSEQISLSMFPSVDDGDQTWAGPGFVNHQLIGQAVAQGQSSVRFNMKKFGMYIPLPFISILQMWAQYEMYKLLYEGAQHASDITNGWGLPIYGLGTGTEIPIGTILGGILTSVMAGITKILNAYEWFIEKGGIDKMYAAIGNEPRGFNSGGVVRATTEIEATHSYGNKPMSLMWPCFSAPETSITVEKVDSDIIWSKVNMPLSGVLVELPVLNVKDGNTNIGINDDYFISTGVGFRYAFEGILYLPKDVTSCASEVTGQVITDPVTGISRTADTRIPQDMVAVEGIVNMLPQTNELKNLQVNNCDYTFPAPPIHDYMITLNNGWNIGVQASAGEIIAYSADDIKLVDGPASNMIEVVSVTGRPDFFGLASSYTAIEVKAGYDSDYLRPWAVTPNCIALNINKINCVQDARAYHGFDGQFNRITSWKGGNGLDSATQVQQYAFIVNNHFKRSNLIPPSEFFGLFNGPPQIAMTSINEQIANQVMDLTRQKGLEINVPGEDRDLHRYSIPIHSELLMTLPASVRMLAPYKLNVVEGVTSLTTDVRNTQTKYKAPSSVDFNLYDTMYRATEEYVALLTLQDGVVAVQDKVPSAGLTYIGATTKQAFFYSPATRMYYSFSGGGDITKKDILNRFKDVKAGVWDFVNQEVMFKALLNDGILVDDVNGYIVSRLDDNIVGEVYPPNETLYNRRSDFKVLSMAGGTVYQGPKRCIVNRFVILDSMYEQIKQNKRRWKKLDREAWEPKRDYMWDYVDWHTDARYGAVFGWTHNPWRAATAMLGTLEENDQMFEWELTFTWTEQLDKLFEQNEFVSFNVMGETITQGGRLLARPTHIFLYRELFKTGYYTTRYQSKNGAGNRERLYMWGDGLSALEELNLYVKDVTKRRTQPIATSQVDVQELSEQ